MGGGEWDLGSGWKGGVSSPWSPGSRGGIPLALGQVPGGALLGLRGKNLAYLSSARAELCSKFGGPGDLEATRERWRACMLRTRLASGGVGAARGRARLYWSQDWSMRHIQYLAVYQPWQNTAAVRLVLSASSVFGCLERLDWHISDPAAHRSSLARNRAARDGRMKMARYGG